MPKLSTGRFIDGITLSELIGIERKKKILRFI